MMRLKIVACGRLGHIEEHCWKKDSKPGASTTNYLELLVDNEEAVRTHFDKICGDNHELFSHTMVPKQWVPMDTTIGETKNFNPTDEEAWWRREKTIGLEKIISNKIKDINPFHQGENILDPHRNNTYHTKKVGVFGGISQTSTHVATTIATMGSNLAIMRRTSTKVT